MNLAKRLDCRAFTAGFPERGRGESPAAASCIFRNDDYSTAPPLTLPLRLAESRSV